MTTHSRERRTLDGVAHLPLLATLNDALGLAHRFVDGEHFRHYVEQRLRLVVPMCCLMLFVSVACGAAVMLSLGEMHHALVLAGVLLLPVIVVGSLFVQAYAFFAWLENRALAHRAADPQAGIAMGPLPPVPWGLAAVVLLVPLVLLAFVAWKAALVVALLVILAPFLYALLDG